MKKSARRFLSLFAAIIMVFTMIPFTALADQGTPATVTAYKQVAYETAVVVDAKYYEKIGTTNDLESAVTLIKATGAVGGLIDISEGTLTVTNRQDITMGNITIKGAGQDKTVITGNPTNFNNSTNGLTASSLSSEYKALLGVGAQENVKIMDLTIDGGECGYKKGFSYKDFKPVRLNGGTTAVDAYLENVTISGPLASTTLILGSSSTMINVYALNLTVNKAAGWSTMEIVKNSSLVYVNSTFNGSVSKNGATFTEGVLAPDGSVTAGVGGITKGYYELNFAGASVYTTIPYAIEQYNKGAYAALLAEFLTSEGVAAGTTVAQAMTADLTSILNDEVTLLYGKDCDEMRALAEEFRAALAGLSADTDVDVTDCLTALDDALIYTTWHDVKNTGSCPVCGTEGFVVEDSEVDVSTDDDVTVGGEAPSAEQEAALNDVIADINNNDSTIYIETGLNDDANAEIIANAQNALINAGVSAEDAAAAKPIVNVALQDVVLNDAATPTKLTFTVTPTLSANGKNVKISSFAEPVTFHLPIYSMETKGYAKVAHDGLVMGVYPIQTYKGQKYVEISSSTFSTYSVEPIAENVTYVAAIGEEGYTTLAAAVSAAKNGATITLLADVTVTSGIIIPNKGLTIDGQDHTITFNGSCGEAGIYTNIWQEGLSATTTIKNVTLTGHSDVGGYFSVVKANGFGCTFNLDGVTFTGNSGDYSVVANGSVLNITDCVFEGNENEKSIVTAGVNGNNNSVSISNSVFENNTVSGAGVIYFGSGSTTADNCKLSITDCTFKDNSVTSSAAAVMYSSYVVTLNGNLFDNNTVVGTGSSSDKCGVIATGSGAAGSVITENVFVNNAVTTTGTNILATAWIGSNNVTANDNYWSDGTRPEQAEGKDIYLSKSGLVLVSHATNYTAGSAGATIGGIASSAPDVAQVGDRFFTTALEALQYAADNGAPEVKFLTSVSEAIPADVELLIKDDLTLTAAEPVVINFYNNGTPYDFVIDSTNGYTYDFTIAENVTFRLADRVIYLGYYQNAINVNVDGTLSGNQIWHGTDTFVSETGKLEATGEALVMRRGATMFVDGGTVHANYFQILAGSIYAENGANITCGAMWIDNSTKSHEGNVNIAIWDSTLASTGNLTTISGNKYEDEYDVNIDFYNSNVTFTLFDGYGKSKLDADTWLQVNGDTTLNISAIESEGFIDVYDGATMTVNGAITGNGTIAVTDDSTIAASNLVAKANDVVFTSLEAALAAAENGDTVTLLKNVELTDALTIAADVDVVLDLNGYILSGVSTEAAASAVIINYGKLTVKDSATGGKITTTALYPDTAVIPTYANNTIKNSGTLIVESGIIENASPATSTSACYAIDTYAGSTTIINGGTITSNSDAIRLFSSISADCALTINGGTVSGVWAQNPSSGKLSETKYSLTITGGTVGTVYVEPTYNANVSIEGGNIEDVVIYEGRLDLSDRHDSLYGIISGGTFSNPVDANMCEEGFVPAENGDGTYGVVIDPSYGKAAKVGDTYFDTLADALAALKAGDTLTLLKDVTISNTINVTADLTIDGNGHTLTYTGSGDSGRAIDVKKETNGADLTVKNLTIDCTASYCERGINYNTNGTLTLDNVTVKGTRVNYAVNFPASSSGATVNVTDSSITAHFALNIWGSDMVVNVVDSKLYSVGGTSNDSYATIALNSNSPTVAENTVVTMTGGLLSATYADGSSDKAYAVRNRTETGVVNVSDTTIVIGVISNTASVANVTYEGSYQFYCFTDLQAAINKAANDPKATVVLVKDVTIDTTLNIPGDVVIDGNGHTLTYTGYGANARAIAVDLSDDDIDLVIKDLTIDCTASYCQRGINFRDDNGSLTLENVSITGANISYVINFQATADNVEVNITDSYLEGSFPLNIWGENMTINVTDSDLISDDTTEADGHSTIQLNNDGTNIANGTVVTVTGGSVVSTFTDGAPYKAVTNYTATGVVNISNTTAVTGTIQNEQLVAKVTYPGSNQFYGFTDLQKAIAKGILDYRLGATVVLVKDVTVSETINVNGTVVLDLNGHTISQTKAQTGNYEMILNDGNLTIKDSVGGGKISYTDTVGGNFISNTITNRGTLILESGTIENLSSAAVANVGYPYAIDTSIWGAAGEVNTIIKGGTVKCENYSALRLRADSETEAVNITITGGTILGRIEVQNPSKNKATVGKLTISGTAVIDKHNSSKAIVFFGDGGTAENLDAEISGGTISGEIGGISVFPIDNLDKNIITGGSFDTDVTDYCVDGLVAKKNDDGTYGIVNKPVANIATVGDLRNDNGGTYIHINIDNAYAAESLVLKLYSNGTLLSVTEMVNPAYLHWFGRLTGNIEITRESSTWETAWEGTSPDAALVPTLIELYIDGELVDTTPVVTTAEAWAATAGVTTYVAEHNGIKYTTLQAAVDAAQADDVITLLANGGIAIVQKTLRFDKNGFTAVVAATSGLVVKENDTAYVVMVYSENAGTEGPAAAYIDANGNGVKDGDETSLTLQEALDAAANGQVVRLETNFVGENALSTVIVPGGVILNIGAYELEADHLIVLNGGFLTADALGATGTKLRVPKDGLVLPKNAYLVENYNGIANNPRYIIPVWDNNNEYYLFSTMLVYEGNSDQGLFFNAETNSFTYVFNYIANSNIKNSLFKDSDGSTLNAVSFEIQLTWTTSTGTAYQNFVYNPSQVATVAGGSSNFAFSLTNYTNYDNLTVTVNIVTECGACVSGTSYQITGNN